MRDAAVVRAETLAVLGASRHGERTERAAVERFFEREDAVAILLPLQIKMMSRQLEQRFVRFGARVAEERAAHARSAAELRREKDVVLVVEVVGHMNEAADLLGD